tara:strand:- start:1214 stop:1429 length:216 start_codon:yes stop_codon:yes gene_type:complete
MKLTESQIRALTRRVIRELFTKKGIGISDFIGKEKVDPWSEEMGDDYAFDDGFYESDEAENESDLNEDEEE